MAVAPLTPHPGLAVGVSVTGGRLRRGSRGRVSHGAFHCRSSTARFGFPGGRCDLRLPIIAVVAIESVVLAHQGGWDEIVLVAGPLVLLWLLLVMANRRAKRLSNEDSTDG